MEKLLERNIKELIDEFPPISNVLSGMNITCTSCAIGTCKLKDIIEIHNFTETQEKKLFEDIASIVFPGQNVFIPKLPKKVAAVKGVRKFSPPLKMLVEEHVHIMGIIKAIAGLLPTNKEINAEQKTRILSAIDFIKNYADAFHHAKEEKILFCLFDGSQPIIETMNAEHEIGRGHVRAAFAALENGNGIEVAQQLNYYALLLTEHIRKEDEILYPWIDRQLTDAQIGQLFSQFNEVNADFTDKTEKALAFAHSL